MKVVEIGGAQELINMLVGAKDDRTRKEALRALSVLSHSEEVVVALHLAGAVSVVKSTPDSTEYADIEKYKVHLLRKFQDLRHNDPS